MTSKANVATNLPLIKNALAVGKKFPVFPTCDKRPCWSNAELGVQRGDGGYKIATQDPKLIKKYFAHPRATEIAIPMGSVSGLMCVDVDLYKFPDLQEWLGLNEDWMTGTLTHRTRSGGLHFFFEHEPNIKWPAQLREGVDIKAGGNGFVCFPPTEGYEVLVDAEPRGFPVEIMEQMFLGTRGGDNVIGNYSFNPYSSDTLIERIQDASDIYPSLRTLAMRLASSRIPEDKAILTLQSIMQGSVVMDPSHKRHSDWADRYSKIEHLVLTAVEKEAPVSADTAFTEAVEAEGPAILPIVTHRPIGPVQQPSLKDIEQAEPEIADDEFIVVDALEIQDRALRPMEWIIPGVLPSGKVGSIAGASNVAKTYYVCAMAVALSLGRTSVLGFDDCVPTGSLIIGNEEDLDDLQYRIKAPSIYYTKDQLDIENANIVLRGANLSALVVASKNEVGSLEINKDAVAKLIKIIKAYKLGVVFMDPYITISQGLEENSNDDHPIITQALKMISTATGATVIHVHHTRKTDGKSKDYDSYNGDRDAWRGAGSIFSSIDFGITLGNWMPYDKRIRAAWKEHWNEGHLGRFVTVMSGKTKRAKRFDPVIYELIDMPMEEEQEHPLPVFKVSSKEEAMSALDEMTGAEQLPYIIAEQLIEVFGVGTVSGLTTIHDKMQGRPHWPEAKKADAGQGEMKKIVELFDKPVIFEGKAVQIIKPKVKRNKLTLEIWRQDE